MVQRMEQTAGQDGVNGIALGPGLTEEQAEQIFQLGKEAVVFALLKLARMSAQWLDTVANVRLHGSTKRQSAALFQAEKPKLRPLPIQPYDVGILRPVRASRRFRVTVDTNTYSAPAEYAGTALTLKPYPDHLCLYHQDRLIARHDRRYRSTCRYCPGRLPRRYHAEILHTDALPAGRIRDLSFIPALNEPAGPWKINVAECVLGQAA